MFEMWYSTIPSLYTVRPTLSPLQHSPGIKMDNCWLPVTKFWFCRVIHESKLISRTSHSSKYGPSLLCIHEFNTGKKSSYSTNQFCSQVGECYRFPELRLKTQAGTSASLSMKQEKIPFTTMSEFYVSKRWHQSLYHQLKNSCSVCFLSCNSTPDNTRNSQWFSWWDHSFSQQNYSAGVSRWRKPHPQNQMVPGQPASQFRWAAQNPV